MEQPSMRSLPSSGNQARALQTAAAESVATPVSWNPGHEVIAPPPKTVDDAVERESHAEYERFDSYLNETTV